MNEIEELEVAHTAACCAYLDADRGVNRAHEACNAAHEACCAYLDANRGINRAREACNAANQACNAVHEAREDALDAVILADAVADAAVANRSNTRVEMFSAAQALDNALNYEEKD